MSVPLQEFLLGCDHFNQVTVTVELEAGQHFISEAIITEGLSGIAIHGGVCGLSVHQHQQLHKT